MASVVGKTTVSTMPTLHNSYFIYRTSQVKSWACCLGFSDISPIHTTLLANQFVFLILNNAIKACQKCSEVTLSVTVAPRLIFCHH